MSTLAEKLKKLRNMRGMSLRTLGGAAHISHSFIADIESGRSKPSIDTLAALAQALNVSATDLLESNDVTDENCPNKEVKDSKQNTENTIYKEQSFWERNNEPSPVELEEILKNSNVQFDGAPLDENDKEEILDFLRFAWNKLHKKK